MSTTEITDNTFFSRPLLAWYNINKRELPWRETTNPYFIWISEIILQQTRVSQGLDYYNRFITSLPSIEALAQAPEDVVMRLWQGLGYYSRARNLMTCAKQIMEQHGGVFPNTHKEIAALKGIGPYTSAAIASFAYNLPYAAVDGNVYRILSRIFNIDIPIDTLKGQKYFSALAQQLIDTEQAALFNQATMELGATICTPKAPQCNRCPLSNCCLALQANTISSLPVKQGKTKVRPRFLHFIHCSVNKQLIIEQRTEKDIWQGLYQLPLIETDKELTLEEFMNTPLFKRFAKHNIVLRGYYKQPKHQLSHQTIYSTICSIEIAVNPILNNSEILIEEQDISIYALPRLIERYFNELTM
ncbi:MAG: A/G-specific adenine glycosylase [Marinifilaceae bacterium]